MTEPMNETSVEWMKQIVDNPHSDYSDGLEGWPNYWINGDELTIKFMDEEHDTFVARYKLTFIEATLTTSDDS